MESVDLEVLKSSVRWLDEGHRALLVTVVKTWGSSPRPEGAMLAVRDDGLVVGSVSGGCIEDDLIDRVRRLGIGETRPEAVKYGITAEEAYRFGLPCGGTIQLVLEPLTKASGIAELYEAVAAGKLVARTLDMATGAARKIAGEVFKRFSAQMTGEDLPAAVADAEPLASDAADAPQPPEHSVQTAAVAECAPTGKGQKSWKAWISKF